MRTSGIDFFLKELPLISFSLGISVLFVKAPDKAVNLFAFLSPLSAYVWLLMILAGIAVSFVMFFIARYILDFITFYI